MPKKYCLEYNDGRHYHDYAKRMTIEQAKAKVAECVARYFAGEPEIEWLDWGEDYQAIVRYPIAGDDGHSVANVVLVEED